MCLGDTSVHVPQCAMLPTDQSFWAILWAWALSLLHDKYNSLDVYLRTLFKSFQGGWSKVGSISYFADICLYCADSTLVLHPTSSNVNQNQSVSSVQLSAKSSPQSTEVTSGTTLSALNIAGKNHTSNETNHLVGTHGKNHTSNETQPNHLVGTQGKLAVKVPENETAKNEETVRWDPFQPNPSDFEIEDKDEEETVVVKSRLRPMDVFHKGAGENNTLAAKVMKGTHHQQKYNITELRLKRTRNLDVVITHFDPSRTEQMVDYWLAFLQRKRVSPSSSSSSSFSSSSSSPPPPPPPPPSSSSSSSSRQLLFLHPSSSPSFSGQLLMLDLVLALYNETVMYWV